jgi:hypothetical protein
MVFSGPVQVRICGRLAILSQGADLTGPTVHQGQTGERDVCSLVFPGAGVPPVFPNRLDTYEIDFTASTSAAASRLF